MTYERQRTRVFISYSRRDRDVVHRIAAALNSKGYQPDFDQSTYDPSNVSLGISAEDDWWQRLQQMLIAADVIVFCVSADSIASRVCDEEIAVARQAGKRIIPVLAKDIDLQGLPPRLAAQNIKISFTSTLDVDFHRAIDELCAALDVDVRWHREARRLLELASKWEADGRNPDRVLSMPDIVATEALYENKPALATAPPELVHDFLKHSRQKLREQEQHLRLVTGRGFVAPAETAVLDGKPEHAIRLAAAGAILAKDMTFQLVPQLWPPIEAAIVAPKTRRELRGHAPHKYVNSAHYSPTFDRVVTASDDESSIVWNAASGRVVAVLPAYGTGASYASFSPDGRHIATAHYDGTVRLWCGLSYRLLTSWPAHNKNILIVRFSPGSQLLVTGSEDRSARVWEVASASCVATLLDHDETIYDARFSASGDELITAGGDYTARIWSVVKGFAAFGTIGHDASVCGANFSPNGEQLATTSSDAVVRIWQKSSGKLLRECLGHGDWALDVSFSSDGSTLLTSSSDRTARLWCVATGRQLAQLNGHRSSVPCCSFGPDDRTFLTGSIDGTARIWQLSGIHNVNLDRSLALAAALAEGLGVQCDDEQSHLLLQGAPRDLFAAAIEQLGLQPDDERLREAVEMLRGSIHW